MPTKEKTLKNAGRTLASRLRQSQPEVFSFNYGDLCSSCKQHRDETEALDTPLLCKECSTVDETKCSLELKLEKVSQEVRYWQDCYETLLGEQFDFTLNP